MAGKQILYVPDDFQKDPTISTDRASVPEHDIQLSDGRLLRYQGSKEIQARTDGPKLRVHRYEEVKRRRRAGLLVMASMNESRYGMLLSVSASFPEYRPSWAELDRIRHAFYGSNRDAMILFPKAGTLRTRNPHVVTFYECPQTWSFSS